jgi:hypothetical protein
MAYRVSIEQFRASTMARESRYRVADAWARGVPATGSNVSTDGRIIRSYRHVVGETLPDGRKVAYCCHYSMTTAKHCSAVKGAADDVRECPEHGRCRRSAAA